MAGSGATCQGCGRRYPDHQGIPVFLEPGEYRAQLRRLDRDEWLWSRYSAARRDSVFTGMYYDFWCSRMLRLLPEGFEGRLLELMCGGGELARRIPPGSHPVVLFDANVRLLETAARDLPVSAESGFSVVAGTADSLPFSDGYFDAVVIQGGLHHVRPVLPAVLSEIARVLGRRGILIAAEPADDNALIRAIRRWQYWRSAQQGGDEAAFTRPQLERELDSCGLALRSYAPFGSLAYVLMANTDLLPLLSRCRWRGLGRALLAGDRLAERVPLLRGLCFASIFTATHRSAP